MEITKNKYIKTKLLVSFFVPLAIAGCKTRSFESGVKNTSENSAGPVAFDRVEKAWLDEQLEKNGRLKEYLNRTFIEDKLISKFPLTEESKKRISQKVQRQTLKDSPFIWFQDFPLGFAGPPVALLKSFSAIRDENVQKLFGSKKDFLKPVGFGKLPPQDFTTQTKTRSLPLGLGITHTDPKFKLDFGDLKNSVKPPVAVAVVSCGACHIGRVQFRETEVNQFAINREKFFGFDTATRSLYMVGAPNTEFDPDHFRRTLEKFRHYMIELKKNNVTQYNKNIADMKSYIETATAADVYGSDSQNPLKFDAFRAIDKKVIAPNIEEVLERVFDKIAGRIAFNEAMVASNKVPGAGYADNAPGESPERFREVPLTLNGATPGQLDAFNLANSVLLAEQLKDPEKNKELLHPTPAMSDLMSTWTQRLRPYGNWNGNMKDHFYRNLGASFGGVAEADMVDPTNVYIATQFLLDLPSPAYPFPVNTSLLEKGKDVFDRKCAVCHGTYTPAKASGETFGWEISEIQGAGDKLPKWLNVGTDMGRAKAQTDEGIKAMVGGLKSGCKERLKPDTHHVAMEFILPSLEVFCTMPADDEVGVPAKHVRKGYVPLNLTGIWARAPYLHNGSVPTLYQLLSPPEKRVNSFWRGIPFYDRNEVGFVWREDQLNALSAESINGKPINWREDYPTAALYTVNKDSRSNKGHYNMRFTGEIDENGDPKITSEQSSNPAENWPTQDSEDQLALLEFLKTL